MPDLWRKEEPDKTPKPWPPSLAEREEMAAYLEAHNAEAIALANARAARGEQSRETADDQIAGILQRTAEDRVHIAVREFDEAGQVRGYLERWDVPNLIESTVRLWAGIRRKDMLGYHTIELVYTSCLIDRLDLIPRILDHSDALWSKSASAKYWRDYWRALWCLVDGYAYEPDYPEAPAKRVRLHTTHLQLIHALTNELDPAAAVTAVQQEFARANRDRRLFENAMTTIYPSGLDPVRFDLGLWAILRLHAVGGVGADATRGG